MQKVYPYLMMPMPVHFLCCWNSNGGVLMIQVVAFYTTQKPVKLLGLCGVLHKMAQKTGLPLPSGLHYCPLEMEYRLDSSWQTRLFLEEIKYLDMPIWAICLFQRIAHTTKWTLEMINQRYKMVCHCSFTVYLLAIPLLALIWCFLGRKTSKSRFVCKDKKWVL